MGDAKARSWHELTWGGERRVPPAVAAVTPLVRVLAAIDASSRAIAPRTPSLTGLIRSLYTGKKGRAVSARLSALSSGGEITVSGGEEQR